MAANMKYMIFFFLVSSVLFAKEENMLNNPYPDWFKQATIYEVNVRQYTKDGNFKSFENHLPRLKKMGFDVLWFMPIQPIGEENRKGSLGSYYSIKDYRDVNPEFGTLEDFKNLVAKIHELNMHVIIDWVANHTAWDNELTKSHPDWFVKDKTGNFIPPVPDWTDVIDLDYNNQDLRNYMIESLKFWVQETDIDGFRCDVAGMVPLDFWEDARSELEKIKPIIMLAEADGPQFHNHAFDITYNWHIHKTFNAIANGQKNVTHLDHVIQNDLINYPISKNFMQLMFTSNHDENSWNGSVFERLGEANKVFAVLTYTLPGVPLVYSGQETGLNKRLAFFDKDQIDWTDNSLSKFYESLNKLKNHSILANGCEGGRYRRINTSNDKAILSFERKKNHESLIIIANLSPYGQSFYIEAEGELINYDTNEKFFPDNNKKMMLKPWEYHIFFKEES